ncbi:MAG: cation efflux protein [Xanthobacteraceae bacterium]|nr:MAG: cation efflux protein [Xanthobacteraceae bacterium]
MASCCSSEHGAGGFDGTDPRYRRVLWIVIAINAAMFLIETLAGRLAGSQALQADALDFLGDTLTYGLSLAVIGHSLRVRSSAALIKGASLLVMGLWVFGSTLWQVLVFGLKRCDRQRRGDGRSPARLVAREPLARPRRRFHHGRPVPPLVLSHPRPGNPRMAQRRGSGSTHGARARPRSRRGRRGRAPPRPTRASRRLSVRPRFICGPSSRHDGG